MLKTSAAALNITRKMGRNENQMRCWSGTMALLVGTAALVKFVSLALLRAFHCAGRTLVL